LWQIGRQKLSSAPIASHVCYRLRDPHSGLDAMDSIQEPNNEQATRWNSVAGQAWVDAQEALDRMFKPFEDMLVDAVAANTRGRILDVGCGTGTTTLAVLRRLGPTARCTGMDISEPMLAAARARAKREGLLAEFIRADVQVYEFAPAAFDTVMSRFGVMFFDDPVRAFTNVWHAATGDARLRFIAWRSDTENPFMTTAERAAAPVLPNLARRVPDAPGQFGFENKDRVRKILEESGWAEIAIDPVDAECSLPEKELLGYLTRFGVVGRALDDADDRTRDEVIGAVRPAFDPYVHGADVRFTAACWMVGARRPA
jgi:ubiquinone/menaquinone biosynthesis C-methylase UbiE